jgi:hypothetical protein
MVWASKLHIIFFVMDIMDSKKIYTLFAVECLQLATIWARLQPYMLSYADLFGPAHIAQYAFRYYLITTNSFWAISPIEREPRPTYKNTNKETNWLRRVNVSKRTYCDLQTLAAVKDTQMCFSLISSVELAAQFDWTAWMESLPH